LAFCISQSGKQTRNPQLTAYCSLLTSHCFSPQITQICTEWIWCFAFYVLRLAFCISQSSTQTRNRNLLLTAHCSLLTVFLHRLHGLTQIAFVYAHF